MRSVLAVGEAGAVLEPRLPDNQPYRARADDRRVISGIFHILKTGGGAHPDLTGQAAWLRRHRDSPMSMTTSKASDGPISRFEVIILVQRRRRWSTADKVQLVEEAMQLGMSVSCVAHQADVSPSQLLPGRPLPMPASPARWFAI